nr:chloride channel protein [Liquorilactobacillus sicerae]
MLGVIVGISSLLLSILLDMTEKIFLAFQESVKQPVATTVLPEQRLVSVLLGGMIAAIIWWYLRTKFKPTISINKALTGQQMPPIQTAIHVMTQIFYVGTGGSIGKELAPREAGVMLSQLWERLLQRLKLNLSKDDQQLLLAAAAGAGFAGVYSAPLTGMLFCVEMLLKKVSKKIVLVSLTMSSISMMIGTLVKGFGPYYRVGSQYFSFKFLILVIIVAPLCGLVGGLFRNAFKKAGQARTNKNSILWQLPVVAFLTGLISLVFPQIMGNGRALAQLAIDTTSRKLIWLLLLGAILKVIVTILTIKSGASGGTITPSIAVGAALGAILGLSLQSFLPNISIWQCSILGGCSLLAASQQAPLMALMMLFEISHLNYSAILPLGLGVTIAVAMSNFIVKK